MFGFCNNFIGLPVCAICPCLVFLTWYHPLLHFLLFDDVHTHTECLQHSWSLAVASCKLVASVTDDRKGQCSKFHLAVIAKYRDT